jgi:hypothetical protein
VKLFAGYKKNVAEIMGMPRMEGRPINEAILWVPQAELLDFTII